MSQLPELAPSPQLIAHFGLTQQVAQARYDAVIAKGIPFLTSASQIPGLHSHTRAAAIIGGGPAGLIAADVLAPSCEVHLYEQGKTVGRKFLVAGQGGFNLTNSAEGKALLAMYSPQGFLDEAFPSIQIDPLLR